MAASRCGPNNSEKWEDRMAEQIKISCTVGKPLLSTVGKPLSQKSEGCLPLGKPVLLKSLGFFDLGWFTQSTALLYIPVSTVFSPLTKPVKTIQPYNLSGQRYDGTETHWP